jgi:hypothetical protein
LRISWQLAGRGCTIHACQDVLILDSLIFASTPETC